MTLFARKVYPCINFLKSWQARAVAPRRDTRFGPRVLLLFLIVAKFLQRYNCRLNAVNRALFPIHPLMLRMAQTSMDTRGPVHLPVELQLRCFKAIGTQGGNLDDAFRLARTCQGWHNTFEVFRLGICRDIIVGSIPGWSVKARSTRFSCLSLLGKVRSFRATSCANGNQGSLTYLSSRRPPLSVSGTQPKVEGFLGCRRRS